MSTIKAKLFLWGFPFPASLPHPALALGFNHGSQAEFTLRGVTRMLIKYLSIPAGASCFAGWERASRGLLFSALGGWIPHILPQASATQRNWTVWRQKYAKPPKEEGGETKISLFCFYPQSRPQLCFDTLVYLRMCSLSTGRERQGGKGSARNWQTEPQKTGHCPETGCL